MRQKEIVVFFIKYQKMVFNKEYDIAPFVSDERSYFYGRKRI